MIIGIAGQSASGKTEAAHYLRSKINGMEGRKAYLLAFADGIKEVCGQVFGFSTEQLYGSKKNEPDLSWRRPDGTFLTPREALQICGTEFGRKCHPDVWVRYLFVAAHEAGIIDDMDAIIHDVRFRNEVKAIHDEKGKVIHLRRAHQPPVGIAGHRSELELGEIPLSEFDHVLEVAEGIENFHKQLDELIPKLLEE